MPQVAHAGTCYWLTQLGLGLWEGRDVARQKAGGE